MLKSAFPKLWLRAVNCTKVLVSPKSSFGLRVRCLSGFTGRGGVEAKSNGPLTVQQAGYNRFADSHLESNHQGGQESHGGSNFGGQESNADRQTLMHSVTRPQEIRNLAAELPSDAVLLTVGSTELAVIHNITQHVEVVEENMKKARFYEVLTQIIEQPDHKTLVFVQTKRLANSLALKMSRIGFPALRLHGDLSQKERDWTMNEFRSGRAKLLVSTDIAAPGPDVDDIKMVINYDFPNSTEDYVNRIGRTARGNKKGESHTFFTSHDGFKNAQRLIQVLREANQEVPLSLEQLASGSFAPSNHSPSY